MSQILIFIFEAFTILASGFARCPQEIPLIHPERNDTYLCAILYPLSGHRHPIFACNGSPTYIADGDNKSDPSNSITIGSLYIRPGCTVMAHSEQLGVQFVLLISKKYSRRQSLTIPRIHNPNLIEFNVAMQGGIYLNGNNPKLDFTAFGSYICKCKSMPILDCNPIDKWIDVQTCDATHLVAEAKCQYQQVTGTTFSTEISDSIKLGGSVESSMTCKTLYNFKIHFKTGEAA